MDRTVLPIPQPAYPPIATLDARNAAPPPRFEVKAPAGAPNVLINLLDDMGFGQSSAFGGPIKHVDPRCAGQPRSALQRVPCDGAVFPDPRGAAHRPQPPPEQSGRNHRALDRFSGNTEVRPHSIATIAQILRLNGYSTAAFGKWHETPPWQVSPTDL